MKNKGTSNSCDKIEATKKSTAKLSNKPKSTPRYQIKAQISTQLESWKKYDCSPKNERHLHIQQKHKRTKIDFNNSQKNISFKGLIAMKERT